jgi:hypothetical protein
MTNWRELLVTDDTGDLWGTLGGLVDSAPSTLDTCVLNPGDTGIAEWPRFFVHADGEEPNWNTPRGAVDWTGFRTALGGDAAPVHL